ncbi:MAG: SAM-dependent methyltransferase [Candidatus Atabeyarchaeum deiterrae]
MNLLHDVKRHARKVCIVIEHLEPILGKWIWLEYSHISKIAGYENLLFTNVKKANEAKKLSTIGKVSHKSIVDLKRSTKGGMIILDPQSPTPLSPGDFANDTSLLVGGILGDHPPRGRTRHDLTEKLPDWLSRNLGPHQFSVDGAVFVALRVASGKPITDIPIRLGIEITISKRYANCLPFAYPAVRKKPLLTPGLKEYLRRGILKDEETLLRTGKPTSVI